MSPQVGVQPDDTSQTSVGVQAQAELHVTATFSITASSTVSGSVSKDTGRFDIHWDDPISIGVLYHLESEKEKAAPNRSAQVDDTIGWIESNFDASTLDDGGKDENLKNGEDAIILRLIEGMKAAGKGQADIGLDLGPHARPLPPKLEEGLLQLVGLIKFSHPPLGSITNVKVNIWRQAPGSSESSVMMVFNLKPGPQPGTPGDFRVQKGAAGGHEARGAQRSLVLGGP